MAFIPSKNLSAVLDKAKIGLWIEPLADGRIALVTKIPETAIKALYRGAGCSLLLSVVQAEPLSILCLGLRVADEPEHPFTATMPNMSPRDVVLLGKILASGHATIHCLNELNHPVLSASMSMDAATARNAGDALNASQPFLLTSTSAVPPPQEFARILKLALDRFQVHIYSLADDKMGASVRMTAAIPLTLDFWTTHEIFEVTLSSQGGPFRIDDEDEGGKLERMVLVALDAAYPGSSYRSPEVRDGSGMRELTDVLGFNVESICVIESKAISVLSGAPGQTSRRRALTVTGHIKDALNQLRGALKKIRAGSQISDAGGAPIVIPNQQTALAHAIVVLSEMYAFVDWEDVAALVAGLSEDDARRALYQVMDIQELSHLAANCKDADVFNNRLLQRWAFVKEKGTSYVRALVPPSGVARWWVSEERIDHSK